MAEALDGRGVVAQTLPFRQSLGHLVTALSQLPESSVVVIDLVALLQYFVCSF